MKLIRPRTLFTFLIVLLFVCCPGSLLAQSANPTQVQAGKVTDQVVIQSHPDQSYAVFLPSNYTPDKTWPTVFCFDPRGRGKTALERFVEASEKYGYITVCSNNSRNGLNWPTISDIFTNFWNDAHSRFSIDEKRTYAAGLSGGSRLSSTFAARCRGCMAGVIGCAAGYPADVEPDPKTPFAYFGISGVDDFNFGELWQLEKKLSKFAAPHDFETFSGGHEWPPKENIDRAFAWLTLQSIKAGTFADKNFVQEQFLVRVKRAETLLTNKQFADASRAYASIARDFQGLVDIEAISQKADQLSKTSEVKKESTAEEDLYRRQLRMAGEIRTLWMKRPEPELETSDTSRVDARSKLSDLRKAKEQPGDSNDRRLARRVLSHLTIESFETAQASLHNNDYNSALANYELVKEIDPKSANVRYEIARIYALKRQKKQALEYLDDAVELGFKDGARLKVDEAFASLAEDPRFQKLLASFK
jgi:tetratricopeptide (TPR) repeat protein